MGEPGAGRAGGDVIASLLARRILFVTGKGGTGKSTIAAALALVAAASGRRVLCVDVDVKGDLARALGAEPVGFRPRTLQPGVSALALHPEESLQEYLRIYFKVPRFARLTPLARVLDFVATGVPGTREMLVVGKIAYEERRQVDGRPAWDVIVVDGVATGQVLPQLSAARSMMELTRGGMMRAQTEWVDRTLTDPRRTLLAICALPEEMAVVEAIELHDRARAEARVAVGACFLNGTFPVPVTAADTAVLERLATRHADAAAARLGGDVHPLLEGAAIARRLHSADRRHAARLRGRLGVPVVEVPRQVGAAPGLETTRAVAAALGGART
ncbi:MAG TPA: ArsA-related P-loop ATPase [Candidatus Eisenbacteria bacterium]|nr:ArsA-related P-loop ATPase [Candidatus Eisenbacteria bacterium]